MTTETIEIANTADGITAVVTRTDRGFSVRLRDDDAGEYLDTVRLYPAEAGGRRAAIEYARSII